jgi:hypothetical protein
MSSSLLPERLDLLVLWRLASTPRATPSLLRDAVRRFVGEELDVEAVRARLESRGLVLGRQVSERGEHQVRGIAAEKQWRYVAARCLPLHALGLAADLKPADKGGWPALVLARHYGLYDGRAKAPSLNAVVGQIVWRRLGLEGKPAATIPPAIVHTLLASLGSDGDAKRMAASMVKARNADAAALLVGVVKAWLEGRDWTRPGETIAPLAGLTGAPFGAVEPPGAVESEPLDEFARRVREAATRAHSGLFGDRKVLISALFRELGASAGAPDLESFKHLLVQANQRGLLHLHRADFPEGLDQTEVDASATKYLHTVFHFVERQESP